MTKAVAINGSPQMEKGNTALVPNSFIRGMLDARLTCSTRVR